jgi:hypothetical protein
MGQATYYLLGSKHGGGTKMLKEVPQKASLLLPLHPICAQKEGYKGQKEAAETR